MELCLLISGYAFESSAADARETPLQHEKQDYPKEDSMNEDPLNVSRTIHRVRLVFLDLRTFSIHIVFSETVQAIQGFAVVDH